MVDPQATILIIEDDLDAADILQAYLQSQGYQMVSVDLEEDAILASLTNHLDLIILDTHLPDIDVSQVAQRLKDDRRTEEIPIILITGEQSRDDRLQGEELEADDSIAQPSDMQELLLRLRSLLRRAEGGESINPETETPES